MKYYPINESIPVRKAFGAAFLEQAKKNKKLFAVSADLAGSLSLGDFITAVPSRYLNVGVAEQSMIGVCAGLAIKDYIPFACTFGCFLTRAVDQIRQSIVHNQLKVILVGSHGGVSNAQDGASAHALEDLAIFSTFPNMAVVSISDANQMIKALPAIIKYPHSVYLRLYREPLPVFNSSKTPFKIGQANVIKSGKDLTLVSTGPMVYQCLQVAEKVKKTHSVEVIDCHTIKPIDASTVVKSAKKTKKVLTVEDHSQFGGLNAAISQTLSQHHPTKIKALAITKHSTTGSYLDVLKYHSLDQTSILKTIRQF